MSPNIPPLGLVNGSQFGSLELWNIILIFLKIGTGEERTEIRVGAEVC